MRRCLLVFSGMKVLMLRFLFEDVRLTGGNGNTVFEQTQRQLSALASAQIKNDYVAKVKPGAHSLIVPLGAKASLPFKESIFTILGGNYAVELLDISGAKWIEKIYVNKN